ncbi:MAG: hypothetical protein ACFFB5_09610 [Promethearchaeota archaeon]
MGYQFDKYDEEELRTKKKDKKWKKRKKKDLFWYLSITRALDKDTGGGSLL